MKITFTGAELACLFEAVRGDGTKTYPLEKLKMAGDVTNKLAEGLEKKKEKRINTKTGQEEEIENIYFVKKEMDFSISELSFIKSEFDKIKEWSIQRAMVIEPLKNKLDNPEEGSKKKEDENKEDEEKGTAKKEK